MEERARCSEIQMDWMDYISSHTTRLVIPIGPRFQAVIPASTTQAQNSVTSSSTDTSKWLGTRTWPPGPRIKSKKLRVGQGRTDSCSCPCPGSEQCVRKHVISNNIELQMNLGPAFKTWKFDEMGMLASNSWSEEERRVFEFLVRSNPVSEGKSFLKPSLTCFSSKDKVGIVRYYFGVHVPNRIGVRTRAGCRVVDSDDDGDLSNNVGGFKKRSQMDECGSRAVKARYLAGRR